MKAPEKRAFYNNLKKKTYFLQNNLQIQKNICNFVGGLGVRTHTYDRIRMKKVYSLLICLACAVAAAQAGAALQKSDKLEPRWVKHTPKAQNPNIAYRTVQVYVDRLDEMPQKSLEELTNYLPQEWNIRRFEGRQVAEYADTGSQIHVIKEGSPDEVPLRCELVDSYWELVQMGRKNMYRCYVLYQMKRPDSVNPVERVRLTDKYGFGPVALSVIPGAGQMYKGSYLKGGLIMGASALCAGGIVLCETTKAGYTSLANKEHNAKNKATYTTKSNNWATGSYICIGALAALWIYNLIDAGVAPGARHTVVDNSYRPAYSFGIEPTMLDAQTPALTARFTF